MKETTHIIDKDHGCSEFWGIGHELWDIQQDGNHGLNIRERDDFTGI